VSTSLSRLNEILPGASVESVAALAKQLSPELAAAALMPMRQRRGTTARALTGSSPAGMDARTFGVSMASSTALTLVVIPANLCADQGVSLPQIRGQTGAGRNDPQLHKAKITIFRGGKIMLRRPIAVATMLALSIPAMAQ
jgi:hypothetical protein